MSQSTKKAAPANPSASKAPGKNKNFARDCIVLSGANSIIACGSGYGMTKIHSRLVLSYGADDTDPWAGLILSFPLGPGQKANIESGFGVKYAWNADARDSGNAAQQDDMKIAMKFPRDHEFVLEELSGGILGIVSSLDVPRWTLLKVSLRQEAKIVGYGMPFRSPDVELNEIMDSEKLRYIVDGISLVDFLRCRQFRILVPRGLEPFRDNEWVPHKLGPPFSFPYGDDHSWDDEKAVEKFKAILARNKMAKQYRVSTSFKNDNDLQAVLTQVAVQDVMWLDDAAIEIRKTRVPAYFVPASDNSNSDCFLIMETNSVYREKFAAAWRHLTKEESCEVDLFDGPENSAASDKWACQIVNDPAGFDDLKTNHPTSEDEIVLRVRRPDDNSKFLFDAGLKEAQQKVRAAGLLHPRASPSNFEGRGFKAIMLERIMELQRTVMRGEGLWQWMNHPEDIVDGMAGMARRPLVKLPVLDCIGTLPAALADAIVAQTLPEDDRQRFRNYLRRVFLGVGIIRAGAGFGKTTTVSAAALALQASLSETGGAPIIASGPTDVAVDNLAARLHRVTTAIVEQANAGKQPDDPSRFRRCFVVRGYKLDHEITALKALLQHGPKALDKATVNKGWKEGSKWKPHLSLVGWFLALLGVTQAVSMRLHRDDKPALHEMREKLAADPRLDRIRAIVTGKLQGAFTGLGITDDEMGQILIEILSIADIFCTTPAASENIPAFRQWRDNVAHGVVLDEAACMSRHDALQVWGNTMMPLIMGGGHKYLRQMVMTGQERDRKGNYLHHLVGDGRVSFMEFIIATGFPVHQLGVQQ
ncbi:hypothetical protein QBC47DRAFT_462368 [Echria macrotheca]|uniref:Uncharacterized protein n=1 Tax=Echria macrotheca TaxID=438768 RepID=A0AAJ0B8C3_9PEZI|nr:hypothetical protein QBC47DRAFT_462368 [Echria macrotheca]